MAPKANLPQPQLLVFLISFLIGVNRCSSVVSNIFSAPDGINAWNGRCHGTSALVFSGLSLEHRRNPGKAFCPPMNTDEHRSKHENCKWGGVRVVAHRGRFTSIRVLRCSKHSAQPVDPW